MAANVLYCVYGRSVAFLTLGVLSYSLMTYRDILLSNKQSQRSKQGQYNSIQLNLLCYCYYSSDFCSDLQVSLRDL